LISTGTERLIACGGVPEPLHQSMTVPYMEGSLALPVKYGYSLVGEVISSTTLAQGTRVHLMHPHQDYCSVRSFDASVIPAEIPLKRALLASNMETVINAVWDAGITGACRVLIAGYGSIGALLARVCSRHLGCEVHVLENNPLKKEGIRGQGYQIANEHSGAFDVAFHAAASSDALQYCIDRINPESAVIELSWYGNRKVSLSLGGSFHRDRKKIMASQVSVIPPHKKTEWDFVKRKEYAFRLLEDDFFDGLLTHEIPFADSALFFNQNRSNPLPGTGYYISYQTPAHV
jgi:threonine dehydrogenase-like Zn-dependent dehydrogenase